MAGKQSLPPDSPVHNLHPGASMLNEEEVQEVLAVIKSRSLSRDYGPDRLDMVSRFEQEFASKMGSSYALAVTSGTAALKVALVAAGVGPGDEVIVPAVTFIATPGSVVILGAVPIFCEVDESMTMDPDDLESKITSRTRAIFPVHLWGTPCKMDRIMEVARKHDLKVIEDCAQSTGATYQGRPIGTLGDLGAFSMQFGKIITSGEGGVLVTEDAELYERAVRYHDQGSFREKTRFPGFTPKLDPFVGENFRVGELTGAVALIQLRKIDQIVGGLRARFNRFKAGVTDIPGVRIRPTNDDAGHLGVHWDLIFDDAETCSKFSDAMRDLGHSTNLGYGASPVYMRPQILNQETASPQANPWNSPSYNGETKYGKGLCPKTEDLLRRVLLITSVNPLYPEEKIDGLIDAVRKAAKEVL
jgi:8-amino-3,8-dideoxy-alpha-D-manno-octulosonate transaminase